MGVTRRGVSEMAVTSGLQNGTNGFPLQPRTQFSAGVVLRRPSRPQAESARLIAIPGKIARGEYKAEQCGGCDR
jgi:hypothetical protein